MRDVSEYNYIDQDEEIMWMKEGTNQPTNQLIYQPTYQSNNLPTNQPTNQPTTQPIYQSTNQPTTQLIYQPTNQSTNQPTSHPTNLPTKQPTNPPFPFLGMPTLGLNLNADIDIWSTKQMQIVELCSTFTLNID